MAAVVFGLGAAPSTASASYYCLPDIDASCMVRPSFIGTGAHTFLRGVHWRSWDQRSVVGVGRLIETGGCCGPSFNLPAKIRLAAPEGCGRRLWYTRIWVTYGAHYHQRYMRGAERRNPCTAYRVGLFSLHLQNAPAAVERPGAGQRE